MFSNSVAHSNAFRAESREIDLEELEGKRIGEIFKISRKSHCETDRQSPQSCILKVSVEKWCMTA